MPKFKQKNTRKIVVARNSITTLDAKHQEIIDELRQVKESDIPALRKERTELREQLSQELLSIDEKLEIKDRLREIATTLRSLKEREKNYLLNNSELVFDYFENKMKVTEGTNKTTVLNEFFKTDKLNVEQVAKERNNVQKFLTNVDDSFMDIGSFVVQTDICETCRVGEMIPIVHEGQLVCNNCSSTVQYLVENEKPSYKEPPKEVCFYAYKRINHFREVLAQFQAKETTQIPDEVLENIKLQITPVNEDLYFTWQNPPVPPTE